MTQRMTQEQALKQALQSLLAGPDITNQLGAACVLSTMLTTIATRRNRARQRAAAVRATLAALKAGSGEWGKP